jgi:phosphoribosylformylglycinamidine synthase subunit PurS
MTQFEVIVQPRPGVRDPQADAISAAMHDGGYAGCRAQQVGRYLLLSVDDADVERARSRARALCEGMLVNPLIETYVLRAVSTTAAAAVHREGQV